MAMFKKNDPPPQKSQSRPLPAGRGPGGDGAMSIIGAGMTVVGDIHTEGIIRIEGEVRGTIRAGKAVVLGPGGRVEGDILTGDALIGGAVRGSVVGNQRVELQSTCAVIGEIHARPQHLKLDEGARFSGAIRMLEEEGVEATGLRDAQVSSAGGSRDASAAEDRVSPEGSAADSRSYPAAVEHSEHSREAAV